MNKKSLLYILLDSVFLVVFNVVFFVWGGTEHPASVWISYGFIHFAYLMVLVTPFLTRKSSSASIFGFTLYSVSSTYFIIEFIVGLIFIFVGSNSYKASLVVQVILAGLYAVMLISNLIANEHTAESIEKHEDEVAYIKNVASQVKTFVGKSSEKRANKALERLYDLLHSSPAKSVIAVKSLEDEISTKLTELGDAVVKDNSEQIITISSEITLLIEERNRKLRIEN